MANFFYVAKNQAGEVKNGNWEAAEEKDVVESLRKDGFWVTSIGKVQEKKKSRGSLFGGIIRVPLKSKMIFCRHLAVMIGSGLSLSRALNILSSQEKNAQLRKVIVKIEEDIRTGVSLADSMAKYPGAFNSVFVSMVRVGELSGNLEEILNILSEQLEKDHKLVSKIRGAMIYPSIIVCVMIVMGILVMALVVPKITSLFKEFDAQLPLMTRIIIAISDFMQNNLIITLVGLVALAGGVRFFAKTETGRKIFHKFFVKAPVIGPIVTKVNSARFARILSSLLKSGVALVEALKITSDTLGNYYYKEATVKASQEVQKGIPLSKVLYSYDRYFPHLVIQMVEVGEETGKTEQVLLKLASFYEEEVDQVTKNLSSIIEPVLMVVIGGAVGIFAVSIIQPIYSVMDMM